jgi:ubiquitin-conjugating enzyme E2 D/E
VVLFDISGSMGGKFFNEPDLIRIGACKLFFEALAYRTIAYSFEHVVSLVFFDHSIDVQCDFTEAIYDFNRLVSNAHPRGSTLLYDSIVKAVHQLLEFKKRYPECILRILALTDGEDTGSANSIFQATKAVVTNDIIIDSFAVGANC